MRRIVDECCQDDQTITLMQEMLTDGSKVYNLELRKKDTAIAVFYCEDYPQAQEIINKLKETDFYFSG